jgi:hypothetical protein
VRPALIWIKMARTVGEWRENHLASGQRDISGLDEGFSDDAFDRLAKRQTQQSVNIRPRNAGSAANYRGLDGVTG